MVSKIDSTAFRIFLILLYKGLLLRKRHYIVTAFETIIPVIIACIPVIMLSQEKPSSSSSTTTTRNYLSVLENEAIYPAFDPLTSGRPYGRVLFAYTPSNAVTDKLMNEAVTIFKRNHLKLHDVKIKAVEDRDELENFCMAMKKNDSSLDVIGTLFKNMQSNENKTLPPDLDYTIRYSYSNGFQTNLKYGFSKYDSNPYKESKFLSWQAAVERAFIETKMEEENYVFDYTHLMQQFPFPEHMEDWKSPFLDTLYLPLSILSFSLFFAFFICVINLARRVIEEKSNGSKELFKMMGMTNFTYWFSTFLNYFVVGALVFLIVSILYKVPFKARVLLPNSNFLLLYIVFLIFMASLILFCFAVTTFFNRAIYGVIVTMFLYILSFALLFKFVFFGLENPYQRIPHNLMSEFAKFGICLLPPGALFTLGHLIEAFENRGEGLQWYNLYSSRAMPNFNVSTAMIAMLSSCFLYALIIWYIDAGCPWLYGIPKPLYFPFTIKCGYEERKTEEVLLDPDNESVNSDFFEDDPTGISPGVVISKLSKVYKTGFQRKVAVKNVSLNMYKGQITALLGKNGAGKTTIINILTGLFAPSGGTASINGWDIFSQATKARQSLGVCPQHNVLYDTLTVEEHLKIYAVLKGVKWNQINIEINNILTMLDLVPKKYELTKNLSGGMKRKLSLGIAIIGGSKVLFLDEPTSGMDAEARRKVWDTLLDIRHDRTIVITTHYMEEADILADRIAIMADGEIQCCGSPIFLKKTFGTGYHLHLEKKENFNINSVQRILTKYVPRAIIEYEYENVVSFNFKSSTHSNFRTMFEELEDNNNDLGIESCCITVTTMEDVFLHVANLTESNLKTKEKSSVENVEAEMADIYKRAQRQVGSVQMFGNHFYGLILKRLHYSKRNWFGLVSQLILPFLLMCLCFYMIGTRKINRSKRALKLDLYEIYGKTDGFYRSYIDVTNKSVTEELKKVLQEKSVNVQSVLDPEKFVIDYGQKNIANYYQNLIVGGEAAEGSGKLNLSAWFNGFPYHSLPISLLSMDTAILRTINKSGHITLTNEPLPESSSYDLGYSRTTQGEVITVSVFVPLAFSFLTASFVLDPIHERATGAKLLQMMTGIYPSTYWLAMFVWDLFVSIIISVLLIIPYAIFSYNVFFPPNSEAIGTAVLMMILYGWSSIPFTYLFSLFYKKPMVGFSVILAICLIIGVASSPICIQFDMMPPSFSDYPNIPIYRWILRLFPSFALSYGFANLFEISYSNEYGDEGWKNPLTMNDDGCGQDILFLFLDGILYSLLLLLFEFYFMYRPSVDLCGKQARFCEVAVVQCADGRVNDDSDVMQEEQRVKADYLQLSHSEAVVALDLTKGFRGTLAVDRLTFGIHKKECFGLLGVNGAGKTTTFRMLTGDCYPTKGNAFICSNSVITALKQARSHIGYCPQFDPLIDKLSAREMISLFARLRDLSGPEMTRYVNALIKMTDLTQYADTPSGAYSGGNKRKLSVALALIGAPPLLLLDEPTTGVDPVSRRKIWKILSLARTHSGAAVILTTHSMEECEALCDRVAIMVNGRFRCLGSIPHIKSKYGQGFTLIAKMKNEGEDMALSINAAKTHIETYLPGATLKDDHQGTLQYHVVNPAVTLSYLFAFMDGMKSSYDLEDYVISNTSLEHIFMAFAKSQRAVAS